MQETLFLSVLLIIPLSGALIIGFITHRIFEHIGKIMMGVM